MNSPYDWQEEGDYEGSEQELAVPEFMPGDVTQAEVDGMIEGLTRLLEHEATKCGWCHGTGFEDEDTLCPECRGSGRAVQ